NAGAVAEQPKADGPKLPRTDHFGDPLPPDALLRLGTLRHRDIFGFWKYRTRLVDGKTLVGSTDDAVVWVNSVTGRLEQSWPLPAGLTACGFSEDGRLALLTDDKQLRLWDLSARKEVRVFEAEGQFGKGLYASFAPDGKVVLTDFSMYQNPRVFRVW